MKTIDELIHQLEQVGPGAVQLIHLRLILLDLARHVRELQNVRKCGQCGYTKHTTESDVEWLCDNCFGVKQLVEPKALQQAARESEAICKELAKARKVDPASLREPMTI